MVLPACFFFPRASACLILACLILACLISAWHAVWHNLTSMTPAVDHDYIPGMITSHRACRKSSQNLRPRPKECRTLLWSAEVWRAHHRFDRGLCHTRSFGKQRREKKTSEPGGTRRRRGRHVVRPSVQHTPLDPTENFRGKHILFLFWPSVTSHYLVEETPPPCKTNGQVTM